MHPFPHQYTVSAVGGAQGTVQLGSQGIPSLATAAPKEFDGPGDQWSPETLLTGAVVDCFILSLRAVANASKYTWTSIECRTEGVLERIDGVSRFTRFTTHATLKVPAGADPARGKALLEKAEKICLIANSLSAERHLVADVIVG